MYNYNTLQGYLHITIIYIIIIYMIKTIQQFDSYLGERSLKFQGTIIGGAAINLLEISDRVTMDVDMLSPKIPEDIKQISQEFALKHDLDKDWFNNGPDSLLNLLPSGWKAKTRVVYNGENLVLTTLSRADLLKTKLFSYCDRINPDMADLVAMKPTLDEFSDSISWVKAMDANPDWPDHVEKMFSALRETIYG